jgi:hypothetical protein
MTGAGLRSRHKDTFPDTHTCLVVGGEGGSCARAAIYPARSRITHVRRFISAR